MVEYNQLEEFYKVKVNSPGDIIDVDNIIGSSSDFKKIYGIEVIIKDILRQLMIPKGTYLFDPEYGSSLYKQIYEPCDTTTLNNIKREIETVIKSVNRDNAKITYDILFYKNKKGFVIKFTINYKGLNRTASMDVSESILETLPEGLMDQ